MNDLLIEMENEKIISGDIENLMVIILDDHSNHIISHKGVLANPEYRKDPDIIKRCLDHIKEHMDLYKEAQELLYKPLDKIK